MTRVAVRQDGRACGAGQARRCDRDLGGCRAPDAARGREDMARERGLTLGV